MRPPRRAAPISIAAAAFASLLLASAEAHATTIDIVNEASLPRLDASGEPIQKRPLNLNPEAVNRQDCLDDQQIRFTLQLSGFEANGVLEAWASVDGTDCAIQPSRTGPAQVCWSLASALPLQSVLAVDIPVRTILSGAPPESPASPDATASVCGAVDLTRVAVQFLYFAPGDRATPTTIRTTVVTADTVGPPAPALDAVTPGNERATVRWTPAAGLSVATGTNVYCEAVASACSPVTLKAGEMLSTEDDAALRCAAIFGNFGTSAVATPLVNDKPYAFAVAAVDAFGNTGPLSTIACATPSAAAEPAATGSGGGCATAPARRRSAGMGAIALALALAAARAWRARGCP